ncbi:MAG: cation:dicarboxylase symporter family transporter, partial [Muribaculaceae bacterium]|nr:cation:dicarboxylase symporter family transporter [Muribaculaceae bacterium]
MKNIKIGLLPRIFIAIILGILLGGIMPHWLLRVFATVSDLFSEFLGFIVPLLILSLVTVAIVEVGHGAGKMLLATVLIAFASTVIAGVLSYGVGCISFPGMITSETDLDTSAAASAVKPFFQLDIAPLMGVTSALTFAFIMGLGIVAVDNSTLRNFFAGMRDIIMLVISKVIIPLLPIYIFCIFIDITQAGQVTRVLSVFFKIIIVIFILHIFWLLFQYC